MQFGGISPHGDTDMAVCLFHKSVAYNNPQKDRVVEFYSVFIASQCFTKFTGSFHTDNGPESLYNL